MKKKILFLFLSLFLTFSCAKKDVVRFDYSDSVLLKKIYENNKLVCNVKGKFIIYYEDRFFKVKFRCALVKDCNNSIRLFIFGLLNQVIATVRYDGTQVIVLEKNKDISKEYADVLDKDRIEKIIKLFNTPAFLPKGILKKEVFENYLLLFDKNNILYKIDNEFRIVEIKTDNFNISYEFKNGRLKEIDYVDFSQKLSITFL
ncbi:hypothetical protein FHQ18_04295 [Deferribacter autotrophicus]|uniref:DUF4292 domain-containing protein n=1 Tax=Deferribacter autotrophicus TaxID=500465 RepID=A0A5A8F2N1_9BACT|nr:hypothetical protein [Deferribacter autotrophicus]KAA0258385.1 hypothetical protein FHQ18_04295 [Deferribacter autotrophicus]